MRISAVSTLVLATALFVSGCDQSNNKSHPAATPPGLPRVYTVDSVILERPAGSPSVIVLKASGTVRTSGWTGAQLQAATTSHASGTFAYDFIATPPPKTAIVAQALLPVEAQLRLVNLPARIKTLRIAAETNQTSVPLATNAAPAAPK